MGNDKTATTNSVSTTIAVLSVLVKKTVVLFVKADSIGDDKWSTGVVIEDSIEVMDGTKTVASKSQRVGAQTKTVFTDIEGVLSEVRTAGLSVRNNHLRKRHAVEEGSAFISVLVVDIVKYKTLTVVEGDTKVPLLPVDFVTINLERDTLGLRYDERLDIFAVVFFSNEFGVEVVGFHWDSGALEFRVTGSNTFNVDDLHFVDIY